MNRPRPVRGEHVRLGIDMGLENSAVASVFGTTAPEARAPRAGENLGMVWREVRSRLKQEFGDVIFHSDIARLRVSEDAGGRVLVMCPNGFAKAWAEDNLGARLRAIWAAFDPVPRDILITCEGESPLRNASAASPAALTPEPAAPRAPRADARFTFSTFMVGGANMMAATAAKAIVGAETPPFNPVFVCGAYGVGKTHLLQAIAHAAESAGARKVLYLTAEEFLNGFRSALRQNDMQPFKDQLRQCDMLLLDDVHFIAGKPRTEDEFLHTLNAFLQDNKQVVLASHCAPKDIAVSDPRLSSMLRGGFACEMSQPDLDLRRKIIDCKIAQARAHCPDLEVNENVREFLAARVTSSPRELEGVLNNVIVRTAYMNRPVTLETVQEALAELPIKAERKVTVEDIQKAVSGYFGLTVDDLVSARRTQSVVRPRHIAMYLAKTQTTRSLPDIGRRFGGRDHSTVIHAVTKISQRLGDDPALSEDVEAIKRRLHG